MIIATFNKNPLEQVRVEITEYRGNRYLNIRIWFDASEGSEPDWKPSQKGLTLNIVLYDDLRRAILKAGKEIENLLPGPS